MSVDSTTQNYDLMIIYENNTDCYLSIYLNYIVTRRRFHITSEVFLQYSPVQDLSVFPLPYEEVPPPPRLTLWGTFRLHAYGKIVYISKVKYPVTFQFR